MDYRFNCKVAIQKISELKELKDKFDRQTGFDIDRAVKAMQELKKELEFAEELFDTDQVEIRDRVAKKYGFLYVGKFNKYGLARASKEMGWGRNYPFLINREGEIIEPNLKEVDASISEFSEGVAAVNTYDTNSKAVAYYINENGSRVNNKQYMHAQIYKFGVALVEEEPNVYKIIDIDGNVVRNVNLGNSEDMRWSKAGYLGFHKTGEGAWYETPAGKRIPEAGYLDDIGNLNNPCGVAGVQTRKGAQDLDNPYYYIDREGKRLTEGILKQDFKKVTEFYQDRAFVKTVDGKHLLIDIKGRIVKDLTANKEINLLFKHQFQDGVLVCPRGTSTTELNQDAFAINIDGEVILSGFTIIEWFSDGMSAASKDGKMYLVTKKGKVYEPETSFDKLEEGFKEGIAKVSVKTGKTEKQPNSTFLREIRETFYIDKRGRRVFDQKEESNGI